MKENLKGSDPSESRLTRFFSDNQVRGIALSPDILRIPRLMSSLSTAVGGVGGKRETISNID